MVNVYLTGFGPFGDVTENPSSVLVGDLINSKFTGYPAVNVCDLALVPVSIQDCDSHLQGLKAKILARARAHPGEKHLILSLGASMGASAFALESKAKNWMNFALPDTRGNTPKNVAIDQKLYELNARTKVEDCLETRVDVKALQQVLSQKISGAGVKTSADAGDYICNYMFYRACQTADDIEDNDQFEVDCAAVFAHVPSF